MTRATSEQTVEPPQRQPRRPEHAKGVGSIAVIGSCVFETFLGGAVAWWIAR
ncbi:hypothetical protein [Mesorhizobium sp. ORM16]|uniref:hypothetical protein n=1 Tax=Mesorhizobium sp. ORM16 TaxID=3376989 RepID=UPI0038572379